MQSMRLNRAFALTFTAGLLFFCAINSATHGRTLTKAEAANLFGGANPERDCGPVDGCYDSIDKCTGILNNFGVCASSFENVSLPNTKGKSCSKIDATKVSCNDMFNNEDCGEKHRCDIDRSDSLCKRLPGIYSYTRAPNDCQAK